ncbi:hypothetical protein CEXT_136651 [Caerostris extrusa]|uniref:Uncharacterized protein n=1 Tax=Caerostris extrusa TaxID=172846 RepID=A0AAV4X635_CAEEX|nr:hypothetical protein CEXT_136651 [Caerostris extrusa]
MSIYFRFCYGAIGEDALVREICKKMIELDLCVWKGWKGEKKIAKPQSDVLQKFWTQCIRGRFVGCSKVEDVMFGRKGRMIELMFREMMARYDCHQYGSPNWTGALLVLGHDNEMVSLRG